MFIPQGMNFTIGVKKTIGYKNSFMSCNFVFHDADIWSTNENKIVIHPSILNFSHVYFALEIGLKANFVSIHYRFFLREKNVVCLFLFDNFFFKLQI